MLVVGKITPTTLSFYMLVFFASIRQVGLECWTPHRPINQQCLLVVLVSMVSMSAVHHSNGMQFLETLDITLPVCQVQNKTQPFGRVVCIGELKVTIKMPLFCATRLEAYKMLKSVSHAV